MWHHSRLWGVHLGTQTKLQSFNTHVINADIVSLVDHPPSDLSPGQDIMKRLTGELMMGQSF